MDDGNYVGYFGEPIQVAHNVITSPHVDIYIFKISEEEHLYISRGLNTVGAAELVMLTTELTKWPVFFMQAIAGYCMSSSIPLAPGETFRNEQLIAECHDFTSALFLPLGTIGIPTEDLVASLDLKQPPLYVFPITKEELVFRLENGSPALLDKIKQSVSVYGSVDRSSVV